MWILIVSVIVGGVNGGVSTTAIPDFPTAETCQASLEHFDSAYTSSSPGFIKGVCIYRPMKAP